MREGSAGRMRRITHIAGGAFVLVWALHFYWPALRVQFAPDDMMNIAYYWDRGVGKLIANLFLFFSTYIRPAAGFIFFLPLYSWFGLNPLPYHLVITALLLVNTWLAWRFGKLVTGSSITAGLAALGVAYHPQMAELVFLPAFVYDVLCFTFYFMALNCYLAARTRGERLTLRRTVLLVILYIAALEAKEMAVTLPAALLVYELLFHWPAQWTPAALLAWLRTDGLPVAITGALTLVYVVGKTTGPDSVSRTPAYTLHFGWIRYLESTSRFIQTILDRRVAAPVFQDCVPLFWLAAALLCWWIGKRCLWWVLSLMILSPLPITFLDARGGALLYIPLACWAVFAATLLVTLADKAARLPFARRAPVLAMALAILAPSGLFCGLVRRRNESVPARFAAICAPTWSVIQDLRRLQPTMKTGARIYFANDVFDGWDTYFITRLLYRDRTLEVHLASKKTLKPSDLDRMDYVFAFEKGRLKRLKGG